MEIIEYPKEIIARKKHNCNYCGFVIENKEKYLRSVNKHDGEVYTWKSHLSCHEIASKLNMFDYADDGVTEDIFQESINQEYRDIMIKNEVYESKKFKYPKYEECLNFVIKHHLKLP